MRGEEWRGEERRGEDRRGEERRGEGGTREGKEGTMQKKETKGGGRRWTGWSGREERDK